MAVDFPRILSVLEAAVFDVAEWPNTLQTVCELIDARTMAMLKINSSGTEIVSAPAGSRLVDFYEAGDWGARDMRAARAIERPQNVILRDQDIVSQQERSGDFYRGFCDVLDVPHMAGWHFSVNQETYAFSILRSKSAGDFTDQEVHGLQVIAGAASMAAVLSAKFSRREAHSVVETLELTKQAAVVLDRSGYVLEINPSAERMFGPHLQIIRGLLDSNDPATGRRLALLAVDSGERMSEDRCAFVIPRGYLQRGIQLTAIRVRSIGADMFPRAHVILLLNDLEASSGPSNSFLRSEFKLTPREIDVALGLAQGLAPKEVARKLEHSVHTTRTLMKSIYAKLGVKRQSELVARLSSKRSDEALERESD